MRKLIAIIILLFAINSYGADILYIAPFGGSFNGYAEQLLDGLKLSLNSQLTIETANSNDNLTKVLESKKSYVVVGPFFEQAAKVVIDQLCNKNILVILPFYKPKKVCGNVVFYGYDPLAAARQLSEKICSINSGRIAVFYSFGKLYKKERDIFLSSLSYCNKEAEYVEAIPSFINLIDSFVKDFFGVEEVKKVAGITKGRVFRYTNHIDTLIIFAPQKVVVQILNLLDYYDIYPEDVLSVDEEVDSDLLKLRRSAIRHFGFVTPYYLCDNNNFVENYRQTYFSDPTFASALGYDIGKFINFYLSGGKIDNYTDRNMLIGRLLFFDDRNWSVMTYKFVNYRQVRRCLKELSK